VAFGVRADFWLALQANWDSFHAWRALRHSPDVATNAPHRPALPS
jgi:plasmid maintenance system antidote protein VapI